MCTTIKSIFCKKITVYLQIPGLCANKSMQIIIIMRPRGWVCTHVHIAYMHSANFHKRCRKWSHIKTWKFYKKSTFHFWNNRCIRTFKGTVSVISSDQQGIARFTTFYWSSLYWYQCFCSFKLFIFICGSIEVMEKLTEKHFLNQEKDAFINIFV